MIWREIGNRRSKKICMPGGKAVPAISCGYERAPIRHWNWYDSTIGISILIPWYVDKARASTLVKFLPSIFFRRVASIDGR
jgi:hypothetical protein